MSNKAIDLEGLGLFGEGVKKYIQDNRTHWTDPDGTVHKLPKEYLPDDIGGGASSWNDLKDKPFGETEGYIVPEMPVTFLDDEGMLVGVDFSLTVGKNYTVNWNGTDYECTAQAFVNPDAGVEMGAVLGDMSAMMGGESTGEPFIILSLYPEYAVLMGVSNMVMAMDGSTEVTVSIKGKTLTYIDPKYIKDMYWSDAPKEILPTCETVSVGNGMYVITTGFTITEGENYIVKINDTEFEGTAKKYTDDNYTGVRISGTEILGMIVMLDVPQADSGLVAYGFAASSLEGVNTDNPPTVSIREPGEEVIHKIPNKYLDLEGAMTWTPQMVKGEELLANTLVVYEGETWSTNKIGENDVKDLEKLIVYYDNVRYETDVNYLEGLGYYIGNGSLINNEYLTLPASPEPFLFAFLSTRMNAVSIKENGHTVAIYKESENINPLKLPKEYQSGDGEVKCEWLKEDGVISWSNYAMNRITLSEYRKILAQGKKLAININYGMYSSPIARDDADHSIIFMSGFDEATGTPTFTKYTFTD